MTFTYNPADLLTSQMMQVRLMIADNNSGDPLLQDEEINFILTLRSALYGACAIACAQIAAKYSRDADSVQGETRTLYSTRSRAFAARVAYFEEQATIFGGAEPYAGGISIADKERNIVDEDRVPPDFNRGMTDNTNYPVSPAGNETGIPNRNVNLP